MVRIPDHYIRGGQPFASYSKGDYYPVWRDLGISAEDEDWANELFSWCDGHPSGSWFALGLRMAVLWRLAYEIDPNLTPQYETWFRWANTHTPYIGYGAHYVASLNNEARAVLANGNLPFEVTGWDCESNQGPPYLILRPQLPGEKVTAEQTEAIKGMYKRVTQLDPQVYLADRADEIAMVKSQLKAGTLKMSKGPELAVQAQAEAEAYENEADQAEIENEKMEAQKAAAQAEYDGAAREYIAAGGSPGQLGSFSSSFRRIRNQAKRVVRSVVTPAIRLRNEISHSILPSAVREFGRDIDQETRRLGRRIDDQLMRSMKETMEVAPWIKLVMPFIGFIPIIGWVALLVLSPALAIVEITWAAKQRRELDKQIKRSKAALLVQIAGIEAATAEMRLATAELRRQREQLAALAKAEQERRLEFAEGFMNQAAKNNAIAMTAAGIVTAGTFYYSKNKLIALAPLAIYAGWAYYQKKQGPMSPYWECIALEGGVDECRDVWLERQLGPRPDWANIELGEVINV
jgi:hypothetical protein